MIRTGKISAHDRVLNLLPIGISDEILRIASGRRGGILELREIRIRRGGVCSILIGQENIRLYHRMNGEELETLLSRLIGGALYAHRDSIASGYISLDRGIRVGICGSAAYDGQRLVGISDMRSLLFRIPSGRCDFCEELYEIFRRGIGHGMIIYSPPGRGKTTALLSLASSVGSGIHPLRVCVVDERCEFSEEDYESCEVDILKGYKRKEGVEIATRTMSPDLIMIDEIGADDAESLMSVVKCGIPLVATAHAGSFSELMKKPSLGQLFSASVFDIAVGIYYIDSRYVLEVDRI